MAKNITRLSQHLDSCKKLAVAMKDDLMEQKQQQLSQPPKRTLRDQQLMISRLSIEATHLLHLKAARTVYLCNLLFIIFEKKSMFELYHELNSAYRPSTAS